MPEIPYQSTPRFAGPGSSGLDPAQPGIVGGGAIEQGFSNLAGGLLIRAAQDREREQAEQVATSGNLLGTVSEELLKKARDLREVIRQDPNGINPLDVADDYRNFASSLVNTVLESPEVQPFPFLQKHLSTHLPTLTRQFTHDFQQEMEGSWKEWNQFQGLKGVDRLAQAGALASLKDPTMQAHYENLIDQQLIGMVKTRSLTGEQADVARKNARLNMLDYAATSTIESNPEAYVQAITTRTVPEFWKTRGIADEFTKTQRDNHRALALELSDRNTKENARIVSEAQRLRRIRYDTTDQRLMNKFLAHAADPANPALTYEDIRAAADPQNDELDGNTARSLENLLTEHITRGPLAVKTNPVIERDLFKRIYLPDGDKKKIIDTTPIYDAYTARQLSYESMVHLRDEFLRSRSPEGSDFGKEKARFLAGIEPLITKPGPLGFYADPSTPEKFAAFARELDITIDRYQREGKNPRVLFDPESKEYFGKVAKSSKYQSTTFGTLETPAPEPPPSIGPRKSLDEIFGRKP